MYTYRCVLTGGAFDLIVDDARSLHLVAAHVAGVEDGAGAAVVLVEAIALAGGGAVVSAADAAVGGAADVAQAVRGTDPNQTVVAPRCYI